MEFIRYTFICIGLLSFSGCLHFPANYIRQHDTTLILSEKKNILHYAFTDQDIIYYITSPSSEQDNFNLISYNYHTQKKQQIEFSLEVKTNASSIGKIKFDKMSNSLYIQIFYNDLENPIKYYIYHITDDKWQPIKRLNQRKIRNFFLLNNQKMIVSFIDTNDYKIYDLKNSTFKPFLGETQTNKITKCGLLTVLQNSSGILLEGHGVYSKNIDYVIYDFNSGKSFLYEFPHIISFNFHHIKDKKFICLGIDSYPPHFNGIVLVDLESASFKKIALNKIVDHNIYNLQHLKDNVYTFVIHTRHRYNGLPSMPPGSYHYNLYQIDLTREINAALERQ